MELYQLRTFVTVAQTGHLTRAAEQLATSQSAVSAQIKALEEEFQMPLFLRTPKGMVLTASGSELLEQTEKVLNQSELLLHKARVLQTELVGSLRLGLNEDGNFLKIEQLCNMAASEYGGRLKLDILNSSSTIIQQDIDADRLDCGFIFGDFPENKYAGVSLGSQRILITAPAAWKEQIQDAAWKEIVQLPWAWQLPNCPYRKKAEIFFKEKGLETPTAIYSADQDATILAIVASGASIGLVKETDAQQAEKQGKVIIWPGDYLELDLSFIYKRKRLQDPLIKAISGIIRQIWLPVQT